MKMLLLLTFIVLGLSACASRPNIQKDCEMMGDGPFAQCAPYPWYKRGCERFE